MFSDQTVNNNSVSVYLLEKVNISPILFSLLLFLIFDSHINDYLFFGTSSALTILLVLLTFKIPRGIVQLFIAVWLLVALAQAVFIVSDRSQDLGADRDEGVEIAPLLF